MYTIVKLHAHVSSKTFLFQMFELFFTAFKCPSALAYVSLHTISAYRSLEGRVVWRKKKKPPPKTHSAENYLSIKKTSDAPKRTYALGAFST